MTRLLAILFTIFAFCWSVNAQCPPTMPAGTVCMTQGVFNKTVSRLEELLAAKDAVAALLKERGASDAAVASALKVVEGYKELDAINNTIILKQKDVIALYEKVIAMYERVVTALEERLNKPKSAFNKFVSALKTIAYFLAGVALGRGAGL